MNVNAARTFLTEVHGKALSAVDFQNRYSAHDSWYEQSAYKELDSYLEGVLLATEKVLRSIDPALVSTDIGPDRVWLHTQWAPMLSATTRALGVLEHQAAVEAIVGVSGPQIAAARLHRWVWEAAAALWEGNHRREAIQAAAARIDLETRTRIGRLDLASPTSAANEAWSNDPPKAGGIRLRPAGFTPGTADYKSALEGVRFFAVGCAQRIRNISTHDVEQPEEQHALEQLAALSVLARWTDTASVERG